MDREVLIEACGEVKPLREWAKEIRLGIKPLWRKIFIQKISPEEIITAARKSKRHLSKKALLFEACGKSQSIEEWALETGIPTGTIRSRIVDCGWSVKDAVTTPINKNYNKTVLHEAYGKSQTYIEWAKEYGIGYSRLQERIANFGYSLEEAIEFELANKNKST